MSSKPILALTVSQKAHFKVLRLKLHVKRRYTCMYTRDLLKKAKTWHDGYILFHHMNSKCYLLDDHFVVLDECFFRIPLPAVRTLSNVPKEVKLLTDMEVDFDNYKSTIDAFVFEEEKDISEVWAKKRKTPDILDSIAGEEHVESSPRAPFKRKRTNAPPYSDLCGSPADEKGIESPKIRALQGSAKSTAFGDKKVAISVPPVDCSRTIVGSVPGFEITPMKPSLAARNVAAAMNRQFATPQTATPFKAPRFMHTARCETPPSSLPRRMLGTTRPSSVLAMRSLQLDWAKFSEANQQATHISPNFAIRQLDKDSEHDTTTRRTNVLTELQKHQQQDIVPVNQKRRDGEEGDTSDWILD